MIEADDPPPVHEAPAPWRHYVPWAIGGLFQVGYAEDSDMLLVLSSQGRGVFDCMTGEKLARDYIEAHDAFESIRLTADGFGPLEGKRIRMAGLFGGGLPLTTDDGWGRAEEAPAWPTRMILLGLPSIEHPDGTQDHQEPVVIGDDGACELRAFGFSETGRSFVIATSCELRIFAR